jgi:predicted negative regulator of RcsB-dependent stress response
LAKNYLRKLIKIIIMKKFFVLFLSTCISLGAIAQMGKVTSALSFMDQGLLDKAKEALDQALVNEKSKDNPKTYSAKGRLCQESFRSDNPKFKSFYTNPLEEAYGAYQKALELDPKGSIAKQFKINSTYLSLGNDFLNQGAQQFEAKDFEGAFNSFEYNIKIASSDLYVGVVDTGVYFNAGLSAFNGKMWEKAIPYFQKCADMKYEGTIPHFLMYTSYLGKGDTIAGEAVLKKTLELYPDNQDVILQLLDHYYKTNKISEAFSYLNTAKAKDPANHSLYWMEGALCMKQDKYDEAIAAFTKSVELKSDIYDTQFNLGVCYYNKAVEMFLKANEIMDAAKYNVAVAEANAVFIKAIPCFIKANSLKPDEMDALRNLKELYYRLKPGNPEYETKYNEIVKKLEEK